MFEFAFHLGIFIECTNGTLVSDILDNYPPLPLFVNYEKRDVYPRHPILTMQDELGIYRTLRLRDRIRDIFLDLPSSILHKALVLMDGHFPMLERLFLSFTAENDNIPLTLPETFLAPNLRSLTFPDIGPQRLFRFLTTTTSIATLKLSNIQTCFIHPRLLVAHLQSLPQLEKLSIVFSPPTAILHPATEELLCEEETPVLLPKLKAFCFEGVNTYLECLVSQFSTPLLERLYIKLFSQIALLQPRLSHLINTTKAFKLLRLGVTVNFSPYEVSVYTDLRGVRMFLICVRDMPLNWRVDWAAQICNALAPTLSSVENLTLCVFTNTFGPPWQPSGIPSTVSTTWQALLRSFIRVKELRIDHELAWELSQALQASGVSDPGFLPDLQSIVSETNMFTSFIDVRQIMARPVRFSIFSWPPRGWEQPLWWRALPGNPLSGTFLSLP